MMGVEGSAATKPNTLASTNFILECIAFPPPFAARAGNPATRPIERSTDFRKSVCPPRRDEVAIVLHRRRDGKRMPGRQQRTRAGETLHARVVRELRADIVGCRLMPNERLTLEALRERYRIGWSPIREALMRLEADGLVTFEQNKGFRVAAVSP